MTDAYPVAVPTAVVVHQSANPWRRLLMALAVAVALVATGCSGSDEANGNIVPVDAPASGVVYTTTPDGDLQVVTAATGEASVLISAEGGSSVVDVAPSTSDGLYALVQDPADPFKIGVAEVTTSGVETIDTPVDLVACLDPQHGASASVAHEVGTGSATGTQFVPLLFAGGEIGDANFDLTSVACPRWTSDRDAVVTAIPLNANDPSSIVTIVQTGSGDRHEIGFAGCGTTPTSISPDDRFLALSLTCYAAAWESSGLYLVPIDEVAEVGDLDALDKLGNGLYGRTSWHPDGEWISAVHADAIASQNIAVDLSTQPVGLQLIEVDTRQIVDVALAGDAEAFSVAWLDSPLGS